MGACSDLFTSERIILLVSIAWAVIGLLVQWILARGGGRKDYSVRAGNPVLGIIYNFTWAMTPAHKETIRLHPVKFIIGILMHVGIFLAILKVLLLLINPSGVPSMPVTVSVILGVALLCGLYLFLRRCYSPDLRLMSSPDDYISIMLSLGLLLATILHGIELISNGALLIYASILFFYLPLGKLSHALFFFIARAEYGARLGYRGTYPVKHGAKE